ncbi:MAG TPA: bifunctional phosphoglucose/phosphomannose isomerase [Candidatus Saccharimonadales bacterium]|nr:bifunctional phosphoglucose/phosphomannose isomerase [Candidatus Saccharimonadales bacterium]
MLDDDNVLKQRDPSGALAVAASQYTQAQFIAEITNEEHDGREIKQVVVAGMGGSALAAVLAKAWLKSDLKVPFEVVRTYDLPGYVDENTLVIASSYSGNTEETISGLEEAKKAGAQLAIIASGGRLKEAALEGGITSIILPANIQPRMAAIYNLRALVKILVHFGVVDQTRFDEIAETADWLHEQTRQWESDVTVAKNYAKQLALLAVGKTPVIYAGSLMFPSAYKWKISWNENAKNVAFCNELPEFNHNEFIGWSSHPVEKPFVVFDLVSHLENPRILKRFEVTDRLLSGLRPKAHTIKLEGDTAIKQHLWASILADFTSIYVAILNGVDPTPVDLVEKLKSELAKAK